LSNGNFLKQYHDHCRHWKSQLQTVTRPEPDSAFGLRSMDGSEPFCI